MGRAKLDDLHPEVQRNLKALVERLNVLSLNYSRNLKINDGYRRPEDQPKNGATLSKHLIGAAVDLDDDDKGTLWKWVLANLVLMRSIGFWMEHPCWTHSKNGTWMHFQIFPPRSGKRIFVPNNTPNPNPGFWNGIYDKDFDTK